MKNWKELREKKASRLLAKRVVAALIIGGSVWGHAWAAEEGTPAGEYMMEDMVITAERIPTKKMDTPANISVITAEDIETNHFSSVSEAISHVNGVIVSNGASGNDRVVRINGDERVVVMIDGRRINNDQGSMTRASANLEMIASMDNIERIEVVKGGGSALYGSDAIGGVINIITKKGEGLRTKIGISAGSWGTYDYQLSNQGSADKVSWYITAGLQRRNHFNYKYDGDSGSMPNSGYKNNSFTARVDNAFDDRSSLRLDFEHRSIHSGAYTNFQANGRQEELFNNVALTYNFKEGTKTPGYLRVYDNYKWASFGLEYTGGPQNAPFSTNTVGVEYQNGWTLGQHQLIAGAEWRESKSENLGEHSGNYRDAKIINKAVYLQDTWNFAPKWSLVPGLRMDRHSMFGTHWSPKIAINYNANDKTQVYASWGRVYKAPTADDLYYIDPMYYMYGNPNLQPESGYTETLGLQHRFDDKTSFSASVFKSEIHDAIYWVYNSGTGISSAENIAHEKKHGLELSFQKEFDDRWSADIGYSYIKTEATGSSSSTDITAKNQQPNGYRLGVHYKQGKWKANLLGTFASGLDRRNFTSSSYALLDFNVSYAPTKDFTIYGKVNNLTNQEYQLSPRSAWGTAYPAQGRFFQIGFTYAF